MNFGFENQWVYNSLTMLSPLDFRIISKLSYESLDLKQVLVDHMSMNVVDCEPGELC